MKPLGDRVLLKKIQKQQTDELGIILPQDNSNNKEGEVIAVSDGTPDYQMKLKVGDRVLYLATAGTPIKYNGDECLLISEHQCVCILGTMGCDPYLE